VYASPDHELFDKYKRPPSPRLMLPDDSYFYINVSGHIQTCDLTDAESLMTKFDFVVGAGWELVHGNSSGASQFAMKGVGSSRRLVWNMPFDLGYRSTSPKGWPQLVLSCIGPDFMGREVAKGYGNTHVPLFPGKHTRVVRLFRPQSSSLLITFLGWIKGKVAEFIFPDKTLGKCEGREVVRVRSEGEVTVVFFVSHLNMDRFGYSVSHSYR
jgi:B9 domain-containing protein 1